ncbi:ESPR-type extended signal peptide-containing protein, partial [Rodentibacter genomosp. 2]|uniref:ESPR-type extended signal peptide-containing protein n=1 Tax=Rodentibacter genomosp. 2 TaxID=1908266 RepID=UPI002118C77C
MNKIFKVIWNQSIGAWVAVSELAKGYCKSSSNSQEMNGEESRTNQFLNKGGALTISKVALSLFVALSVNNTFAATEKGNRGDRGDDRTIVIGESGETNGGAASAYTNGGGSGTGYYGTSPVAHSIAIGGGANIDNISESIALGYKTSVSKSYSQKGSVALGAYSAAGKARTDAEAQSITFGGKEYKFAGAPQSNTSVLSIGHGSKYGEPYAKYRQIQNVAAGRITEDSTDAINGSQLYAVVEALGSVSGGNALENFVVGADNNHTATGINVTKNQNRFDVISGNDKYLTTAVDGTSIKVDLSQTSKDAIDNVSKNAQNITKNAQNITKNAQNITKNAQNITKNAQNITNNAQNITKNAQNITKNAADIAKGFGLKAQDNNTVNKKLGDYVDVVGGNSNINTTVSDGKVKINLNNSLDLSNNGNVKIGDANLNGTGLTINNGPSVTTTGINAGNKKVTNVSDGTIGANSKDAVNGSQLYATNLNVTNLNTEVAKGWNLTTSKSGTGNVSGNGLSKVAMGDTVTIDAGDNINITQAGKKVTIATSSTPNFTSVDTGNLTVRNGGKVDFGGNNLSNIGRPVADNDATTKKYVDDGRTTVNSTDGSVTVNGTGTNPKNYDLSVNMTKVAEDVKFKYSGDNNSSGENKLSETVKFKGSDYVTTNASNGQIAFDLSDTAKNKINNAIQNFTVGADKNNQATGVNITNGGRFDIVGKDGNYIETNVDGKNITVALNQNATSAIEKAHKGFGLKAQDGNNVTKQLGEEIEIEGGNSNINTTIVDGKVKVNLNNSLDLTEAGNVKISDVNLTKEGLTINGGPNVTKAGIDAGNKKITNVQDGNVAKDSKDAINGGQLYTAIQDSGFNLTTNGEDKATDKRISNNDTFNLNQSTNILVKQVDNGYEIATAENVSFTNVTVGKDGKDGTIGVNGKDGSSVVLNGKDGTIGINGKDGASANFTVANGSGTLDNATHGGDGINRLVYNTTNTDGSITTREIATKDDGLKFQGDSGDEIAKKLGSTLNITGGANKDALTDNNIGVISKDGNLTVKLAKDLNLTENGSVT